jgi:hypothetical protein
VGLATSLKVASLCDWRVQKYLRFPHDKQQEDLLKDTQSTFATQYIVFLFTTLPLGISHAVNTRSKHSSNHKL